MVLVTSAIGVFAPILMSKLPFTAISAVISIIIKQFGTGIIIATAFVHVGSIERSPVHYIKTNDPLS